MHSWKYISINRLESELLLNYMPPIRFGKRKKITEEHFGTQKKKTVERVIAQRPILYFHHPETIIAATTCSRTERKMKKKRNRRNSLILLKVYKRGGEIAAIAIIEKAQSIELHHIVRSIRPNKSEAKIERKKKTLPKRNFSASFLIFFFHFAVIVARLSSSEFTFSMCAISPCIKKTLYFHENAIFSFKEKKKESKIQWMTMKTKWQGVSISTTQ